MFNDASRREFLRAVAATLAVSAGARGESPAFFRFPYLQNVRRTRATIRWAVPSDQPGTVEYWDSSRVRSAAESQVKAFLPAETGMGSAYYRFESLLTNLQPGTTYQYRVLIGNQSTPIQSFRTPGTQPFDFLAFGDSGLGTPAQRQIAARLLERNADFVLHTGDLVYPSGTYERYESLYFAYYRDLMQVAPFFPCPGNHDYYEMSCIPYRAVHSLPDESVPRSDSGRYYSFDWGNAHFISLDTNDSLTEAVEGDGPMLRWLEADLKNTTKFWRIVVMHHPAYSAGKHVDDWECRRARAYIAPILDRYSVPLVLNGHEHSYQRSAPIRAGKVAAENTATRYITTGGGGAELHPVYSSELVERAASQYHFLACSVNGARLKLQAILPDGSELDSLVATPLPVATEQGVVNSASYTKGIAPGGLVSIFGFHLSPEDAAPLGFPLPKSVAGVSVLLNGKLLPIQMASGTQINLQLPFDSEGAGMLSVRTPNGSTDVAVSIRKTAPAIFDGAVFHANGTPVSGSAPPQAGEVISVYLTGLGAAIEDVAPGTPAPPQTRVKAQVQVRWGDSLLDPDFAGLAPGCAGVNVVRVRVPGHVAPGSLLQVLADGVESNTVQIPV